MRISAVPSLLLLLALAAPSAHAEDSKPSMTTETYDNWVQRCVRVESGASLCEVAQDVTALQDGNPVTVLKLAVTKAQGGYLLVAVAPLAVLLSDGLVLSVDDAQVATLPYRLCDQTGCWIEAPADAALLGKLKAGAQGKARVVLRDGRGLEIQFPLQGFKAALAALDKVASQ